MSIAFTAPHFKASEVGQQILADGGTAIEAMVAAAAAIASVYPHMNGLGGDGFWLISEPGQEPVALDACGTAAAKATIEHYQAKGLSQLPSRGSAACITMAGAVSGWQQALELSARWQSPMPLKTLLTPAIAINQQGFAVSHSLHQATKKVQSELASNKAFRQRYLPGGQPLTVGQQYHNPELAETLSHLATAGLDDFYRGTLAQRMASALTEQDAPLVLSDFQQYRARWVKPLSVSTAKGRFFNLPAPTQGIASLLILALFARRYREDMSDVDYVHLLVECTKQAFLARDQWVTDPQRLSRDYHQLLTDDTLAAMAARIDMTQALPWPRPSAAGDTIWMGACDAKGRMVSYIQSLYWEFGSGVVAGDSGIVWNNRGISFSLDAQHHNSLQPGMRPFHTLNPAYAELSDQRRICYGTMGGEGQPQTQAALLTRYLWRNHSLAEAIAAPRWLLGRSWGDVQHDLKLEQTLAEALQPALAALGHQCARVADRNELMGHAGAVVRFADGRTEAATDPRSDGAALATA